MTGPSVGLKEELRGCFLFESLTEEQLDWLVQHGVVEIHDAGVHVYDQGAPAESFYVLLDGEIQLVKRLDGAEVVLTTATSGKAASVAIGGLGIDGTLIVLGAAHDPIEVQPMQIIGGRKSVKGWPSGTAMDSQDTMNFSAATGIAPMIEAMPLERAAEAYARMMSGAARFRMVLTMPP